MPRQNPGRVRGADGDLLQRLAVHQNPPGAPRVPGHVRRAPEIHRMNPLERSGLAGPRDVALDDENRSPPSAAISLLRWVG